MTPESAVATPHRRLTTWRQIGDFLGKDERTAKRWEATRAMPVHRLPGGGNAAVYAFTDELERWMSAGRARAPAGSEPVVDRETPAPGAGQDSERSRRRPWIAFSLFLLLGVGAASAWTAWRGQSFWPAPKHVPKPAAAELYRQGRYAWSRRTPDSLHTALTDFTQAAVADPDYADAYAGLADTYNLLREYAGMPEPQAYPLAEHAARRAVALDERNAAAHAALAFVELHWDWDAAAARRDFMRAIALDPRNATAHHWFATGLLTLGDYPAALRQIEAAEALTPESAAILADKGIILHALGREAEAERQLKELIRLDPRFLSPHIYLEYLYSDANRTPEYLVELERVAELKGDDDSRRLALAAAAGFRSGGETAMKRAVVADREALYAQGRLSDIAMASTYAWADDPDRALTRLASAVARHDPDLLVVRTLPSYSAVRRRPGYAAIDARLRAAGSEPR